jgi:enoyl-CoA hydratase/carnithine racemase
MLEGKPFTPAEALANGAVDEVLSQDEVVARATEPAEHFGSRPGQSRLSRGRCTSKRSVYFGGSKSLPERMHVERTEFLVADQSEAALHTSRRDH